MATGVTESTLPRHIPAQDILKALRAAFKLSTADSDYRIFVCAYRTYHAASKRMPWFARRWYREYKKSGEIRYEMLRVYQIVVQGI